MITLPNLFDFFISLAYNIKKILGVIYGKADGKTADYRPFFDGSVNLYGHITPKRFLLIFNKYNDKRMLKDELMRHAIKLIRQSENYMIYKNAIVNTTVEPRIIDKIIYYQGEKQYYVPSADELLKWANPTYYEVTPQLLRFKDFLLRNFQVSPLAIDSLMAELVRSVMIDERMQAQIDILSRYHAFDKNSFDEIFCDVFADFANNTRHWSNCGYTPIEMRQNQDFNAS